MEGRGVEEGEVGLGLGSTGRIPVFVFPSSLIFSAQEREHIKQILTIYNPYDFPLLFRVLSTTPNFFNVVEPEGSIQTKNCVDLIIRLTSSVPLVSSEPIETKFRVQVFHYNTRQPLGRKDVFTTIVFGPSHPSLDSEGIGFVSSAGHHQPTPATRSSARQAQRNEAQAPPMLGGPQINYVAIVTGLVCILGLMLPSEKDEPTSTIIPSYLHLSLNQKLLVAYTLGLVTMVIFRP